MSSLKRTLKELVPPIVLAIARGTRTKRYPSWEAACNAGDRYEADLLNKFRVDRHALRRTDGSLLNGSMLRIVAKILRSDGLEVVDFGGATGDLGIEFLESYPQASYTVVENATLVSMMDELNSVRFTSQMPESCDVFYCSGTLQYLEDPMTILRAGLKSARYAAVLVRNSFSETTAFHVQTSRLYDNGIGPIPPGYKDQRVTHPHRSIRETDVLSIASEMGFELIARLEEVSGSRGDSYGKQLMFLRTSTTEHASHRPV